LKTIGSNSNIEISFGKFDDNKFNSGVNKCEYDKLKAELDKMQSKTVCDLTRIFFGISAREDKNVREISILDNNNDITETFVERKIIDYQNAVNNPVGIKIVSTKASRLEKYDFDSKWKKYIENQINPSSNSKKIIGSIQNRCTTSYTPDTESVFNGSNIDLIQSIENLILENGEMNKNIRYEIKLNIDPKQSSSDTLIEIYNELNDLLEKHKQDCLSEKKPAAMFFGSFDPPHLEHYGIAKWALDKHGLDHIFWIPNKQNPFKEKLVPLEKRLEMLKLITNSNIITPPYPGNLSDNGMTIIDGESLGYGTGKIARTRMIKFIENNYPVKIKYRMVGTDTLADSISRKEKTGYKSFLEDETDFLVIHRYGEDPLKIPDILKEKIVYDTDYPKSYSVSSTFIRENIYKNPKSLAGRYMPKKVIDYIYENNLYLDSESDKLTILSKHNEWREICQNNNQLGELRNIAEKSIIEMGSVYLEKWLTDRIFEYRIMFNIHKLLDKPLDQIYESIRTDLSEKYQAQYQFLEKKYSLNRLLRKKIISENILKILRRIKNPNNEILGYTLGDALSTHLGAELDEKIKINDPESAIKSNLEQLSKKELCTLLAKIWSENYPST
jgi:nicotinate-nucleotide adenylyltransferase